MFCSVKHMNSWSRLLHILHNTSSSVLLMPDLITEGLLTFTIYIMFYPSIIHTEKLRYSKMSRFVHLFTVFLSAVVSLHQLLSEQLVATTKYDYIHNEYWYVIMIQTMSYINSVANNINFSFVQIPWLIYYIIIYHSQMTQLKSSISKEWTQSCIYVVM